MPTLISFLLCLQAQQESPQELKERLDALEKKVQDLESKQTRTVSANPETVFNPRVTVIGNFLWRLDDRHVVLEDGEEVDDTVNVRELELDFRASIDPYADGVAIISLESEVPGEYEAGVEELLIQVKSLPIPFWEEPPLGTKLKLGRMRTEFGRNNRLHLHDLPQTNRPLVVEEFLGEEGHVANGASAQMFLPSPGDTALELTVQALQGGDIGVAQDPNHPAYLANLRLFVPLGDEHAVDVSLIGFYGTNDPDGRRQSRTLSVDALYRWKPLRAGESQSVVLGGQLFTADHEFEEDTDGDGIPEPFESKPLGWTAWAQAQFWKGIYLGFRWDETEFLADARFERRKSQPYVSWYLSEFFRIRASYEHTWSDDPSEDGLDTFLLEINVVFGAHPVEPFWVNK
jgi:hypothetical protein